ncbi:hypothetical protein EV175_007430, partial [Coemansia sp. RSA 1933]
HRRHLLLRRRRHPLLMLSCQPTKSTRLDMRSTQWLRRLHHHHRRRRWSCLTMKSTRLDMRSTQWLHRRLLLLLRRWSCLIMRNSRLDTWPTRLHRRWSFRTRRWHRDPAGTELLAQPTSALEVLLHTWQTHRTS